MITAPEDPAHLSARWPLPRLPRSLWLIAVTLAVLGFGVIASRSEAPTPTPPTADTIAATRAIDALLHPESGRDPITELPADFTTVTGVTPVHLPAPDGTTRAVHVDGGCSTPWGDDNTRWDYSVGCKAHDLGYDLLRYSYAKGQTLDPRLRRALDDKLSADMHGRCDTNPRSSAELCQVVASLYSVGLVVNSWHQRWGPPVHAPVEPWTIALIMAAILLLTRIRMPRRLPGLRGAALPVTPPPAGRFTHARTISLAGIVLGESALALAHWGGAGVPGWLWPLTWLLQLAPVFFFAGGHANLISWRDAQAAGAGYGGYLAARTGWLIRPAFAFLAAWLVVPLSLELLGAPDTAVTTVGRIVVQPLWLLGLYLITVAVTPVLGWLHERLGLLVPGALALLVALVDWLTESAATGAAGGAGDVVLAVLFAQLAFAHGTLARLPVVTLAVTGALASAGLVLLTTVGGASAMLITVPTGAVTSLAPSPLCVLLLGTAQLAALYTLGRRHAVRPVTWRPLEIVRAAPMTAYLGYVAVLMAVVGLVAAIRADTLPTTGVTWLLRPRTLVALALVALPAVIAFRWFERHRPAAVTARRPRSAADVVAAALGVGFGTLGILAFAVCGLTGAPAPTVLGLPSSPMHNLVHVLLGWYLLHVVRTDLAWRARVWLLSSFAAAALAITTDSALGIAVHAGAAAIMLVTAGIVLRLGVTEPAVQTAAP
ncbi:phospholipase A2-like protein [Herbihabitans rhizosphaerae]|uniref:Phospholipase A2-like protein n=1 Tax=Herbihabitans rhizosphaerae TaxID=1872711 RepID=A0A4Q7KIE1_9PSEU|nr:phospholipase A2 [Herbihabitans rhizosphaerae]RZS32668.1 phospholipase A2-like protein [Herbihabitans rhizosphaerae]